jgi:hypothetical protein
MMPKHLTMLDKPQQLELDLQQPKTIWQVQVSKTPNSKSAYKNRFVMDSASQAILYYHAINIGRGYKKRLVKVEGNKKAIIARAAS